MVGNTSDFFRALADPTRLRILHLLRRGELCVGDLVSTLRVPQATASRHLTCLRKHQLIVARKRSYWTFYSLARPATELHRRVLTCLDVDSGPAKDVKRLTAVMRSGGCCPSSVCDRRDADRREPHR